MVIAKQRSHPCQSSTVSPLLKPSVPYPILSPSLEFYDKIENEVPVTPLATKLHNIPSIVAVRLGDSEKHDLTLCYFRAYIADLYQQFNERYPG